MANMTFGVNILPKANANPNLTLGNSDNPWTIVSPSLTGTPTAPTATSGTNTTQIATTAFVNANAIRQYAIGTVSNPCTSLDDIPLNSSGHVIMDPSISPSGMLRQHAYWKSGSTTTRYIIIAVDQYAYKMYVNDNYDGTLKGWEQISFNSYVVNNLTSTSATNPLSAAQGKELADRVAKVKDTTSLGNFASQEDLSELLETAVANMDTYSTYAFRATATATDSPFINTHVYYGVIYKGANTGSYCHAMMYDNASTSIISAVRRDFDLWAYDVVVFKSEFDTGLETLENSHFGTLGTVSSPYASRNSIPLNWVGNVVFDASLSPSGTKRSFSVIKWGSSSTSRYCILAVDQYDFKVYICENYDGTIKDWRSLEPDSIFMRSETLIPSNSNMDNYNTPGVYTVASSAVASSISNIPYTSSGGRLEVIGQNSNSSYQRQLYYPNATVNIYTRNKGASSWGDWYQISMTKV